MNLTTFLGARGSAVGVLLVMRTIMMHLNASGEVLITVIHTPGPILLTFVSGFSLDRVEQMNVRLVDASVRDHFTRVVVRLDVEIGSTGYHRRRVAHC